MGMTSSDDKQSTESKAEMSILEKPESTTENSKSPLVNKGGNDVKILGHKTKKVQITKTFVTRSRTAAKKLLDHDVNYNVSLSNKQMPAVVSTRRNKLKGRTTPKKKVANLASKAKVTQSSKKILHKKTTGTSVTRKLESKKSQNQKRMTQVKPKMQRKLAENNDSPKLQSSSKKINKDSARGKKRKIDANSFVITPKKAKLVTDTDTKTSSIKSNTGKTLNNLTKKISKKNIPKPETSLNSYEIDIDSVIEAINVRIKNSEKQERELASITTDNKMGTVVKDKAKLAPEETAQTEKSTLAKMKSLTQSVGNKTISKKNCSVKGKINVVDGRIKKRKYVRKVHKNNAESVNMVKAIKMKQQKKTSESSGNKEKLMMESNKIIGRKDTKKASPKKILQKNEKQTSVNKTVKQDGKETASNKNSLAHAVNKKSKLSETKLKYSTCNSAKTDLSKITKTDKNAINVSDSDSEHSSTLYSLLVQDGEEKNENSSYVLNISKMKQPSKKKKQDAVVKKEKDESKKTSPKKDGPSPPRKSSSPKNGSQKSPRKMLLKDSMKPKQDQAKTGIRASISGFMNCIKMFKVMMFWFF